MDGNETFKAGLAVRRKVLGEKYVDEALAKTDVFMEPLQQYLTEHVWGATGPARGCRTRRAAC